MATENDNDQSEGSKLRKQLEDALAELKTLKTENVVIKSGIDISKPMAKFFVDHYDGDWTVEAFQEKATEYGLVGGETEKSDAKEGEGEPVKQQEQEEKPKVNQAQASTFDRIFNATQEGGGTPPSEEKAWKRAETREEFMAQYDGMVA